MKERPGSPLVYCSYSSSLSYSKEKQVKLPELPRDYRFNITEPRVGDITVALEEFLPKTTLQPPMWRTLGHNTLRVPIYANRSKLNKPGLVNAIVSAAEELYSEHIGYPDQYRDLLGVYPA